MRWHDRPQHQSELHTPGGAPNTKILHTSASRGINKRERKGWSVRLWCRHGFRHCNDLDFEIKHGWCHGRYDHRPNKLGTVNNGFVRALTKPLWPEESTVTGVGESGGSSNSLWLDLISTLQVSDSGLSD